MKIVVQVVTPKSLSVAQKKLLRELAKTLDSEGPHENKNIFDKVKDALG